MKHPAMTSKLQSLAYFNRLLMPVIVADVAKVGEKIAI